MLGPGGASRRFSSLPVWAILVHSYTNSVNPKIRNMRNILTTLCMIGLLALTGCSGSDVYLGEWKGTDINGDKYELSFQPKDFSIRRENGDSLNFEYTQNAVKLENSTKTYTIKLKDGRGYNIFFPIANDVSKGLMTMENGKPVYTISRTSYLSQDEIYKLMK